MHYANNFALASATANLHPANATCATEPPQITRKSLRMGESVRITEQKNCACSHILDNHGSVLN